MPQNLFSMQAFDDGYARQQGLRKQAADAQAAPMIARGNYQGAAGAYGDAGLAADAGKMAGAQNEVDQQQYQHGRDAKADERQGQEQTYKAMKMIASSLRQTPPGQRLAAFQRAAPLLAKFGVPQEALAQTTEDQLTDQNLNIFDEKLDQHWHVLNTGSGGIYGYDDRDPTKTGKTLREPDKPLILHQGDVLMGEDGRTPAYTAPKTFAPRAPAKADPNAGALAAIEAELRRRGKL